MRHCFENKYDFIDSERKVSGILRGFPNGILILNYTLNGLEIPLETETFN
jgi:hypothetical protein